MFVDGSQQMADIHYSFVPADNKGLLCGKRRIDVRIHVRLHRYGFIIYPHGHETAQPVADRTECFPSWHVRRLAHGNQNCGMPYRARFYCKQDPLVNNYFDIFG